MKLVAAKIDALSRAEAEELAARYLKQAGRHALRSRAFESALEASALFHLATRLEAFAQEERP